MQAGAVLGAYRVVKQIGAGGMGQVWIGEHTLLGRRAAIKVLHSDMSSREDVVRRFFNEAKAATVIPDPGIVQVFDFGYSDSGEAYIVMELLDGESLESRLERGPLEQREAVRLMRQVASTLGAAHSRGIVHRDLKPDNIFIVKDPEVSSGERAKILDFGIAKLADERRTGAFAVTSSKITSTGVLGTPLYMSPEQCRAQSVDARTDVYSLGCVLYQLLTGCYPFDAETPQALIFAHVEGPIPVPSTLVPSLPHTLDDIVRRCLAKDPADRYSSGTELALALASIGNATLEPERPAPIPSTLRGPHGPAVFEEANTKDDIPLDGVETLDARPRRQAVTVPASASAVRAASETETERFDKKHTTLSRATGSSALIEPTKRSHPLVWLGAAVVVVAGTALLGWQLGRPGGSDTSAGPAAPGHVVLQPTVTPAATPTPDAALPEPTVPMVAEPTVPDAATPEPTVAEPAISDAAVPPMTTEQPEQPEQTASAGSASAGSASTATTASKTATKTKRRVIKKRTPPATTTTPPDKAGIVLDANGIPVHR